MYNIFTSRIASLLFSKADWHFVLFKWENTNGDYTLRVDALSSQGIGKFEGQKITSGGHIMIGELKENNDPANTEHHFVGRITCLQMWKKSFSDQSILALYNTKRLKDGTCYTEHGIYSLFTWAQIKTAKAKGEVLLYMPSVSSK